MERLTKRIDRYAYGAEGRGIDRLTGKYCRGEFKATACVEKLAEYEDLEEHGKLLKLPVAVGDKIYYISDGCIEESEVVEISNSRIWIDSTFIDYEDLGKTVYTSMQQAEYALIYADSDWRERLFEKFCQVE